MEEGTGFMLSQWEVRFQRMAILYNWHTVGLQLLQHLPEPDSDSVKMEAVEFLWKASEKTFGTQCETPEWPSGEQPPLQKSEHLCAAMLLCSCPGSHLQSSHMFCFLMLNVFITELHWCCCPPFSCK
jgi:hypothetical protein